MRVRVSGFFWVGLATAAVAGAGSIFRSGLTAGAVWTEIRPWLAILAAAGMHELGHMIAAWGAGARIRGFRLDLFGARLELAGLLSYGRELWIAAGGPIVSLVCAALAYPLAATRGGEALGLFCGASLAFGIFNLLPIGTLDGGRMLRCAAAWLWGDRIATGILQVTTGIGLGMLWLLAVYALLRRAEMLSVFGFSLCLLWRAIAGNDMCT